MAFAVVAFAVVAMAIVATAIAGGAWALSLANLLAGDTSGRAADRDIEHHSHWQGAAETPHLDQHQRNHRAGYGSEHIGKIEKAEGAPRFQASVAADSEHPPGKG